MSNARVLILGSGIAGLSAALKVARFADVDLVAKDSLSEGSTRYAQGGIASVWSKEDSFEEHVRDTMTAGADLCHFDVVDVCVREGPGRVQELIDLGVQFTKRSVHSADYDLHREGGHGKRRILHADDLTGLEIERALIAKVRENPRIHVHENHIAIDLITEGKILKQFRKPGRVLGAYVLDSASKAVKTFRADFTVLATGGLGKVYLYTSNPDVATGDGVAMAFRAGARVANLEFIQFHPTCLYHPSAKNFLITEAMRGEGAVLRNSRGKDFMKKYHPMGSLAPRDIVARSIDIEMKHSGDKFVLLDATHLPREELKKKFPNIDDKCAEFGIDIGRDPIPVVPAAHYSCGGVVADLQARATIEGLYAIGEVACTGLHGANRLASNSLLEAVVFAHRAATDIEKQITETGTAAAKMSVPDVPAWDSGRAVPLEDQIDIAASWLEIRTLMQTYVGIVRSNKRLARARKRLELIRDEVNADYWATIVNRDLIELRNLITVALLIVECAETRRESRGLHSTLDYPERNDTDFKRDTLI